MTKRVKYWMDQPTIAYISALGGVEIKQIDYGIDDYITCVANAWYHPRSVHRVKINYTRGDRAYIRIHGTRLYLDEAIRA